MKVITSFDQLPKNKKIVLTIGNFDGLHRGHLQILKKVARSAAAIGGVSVVLTFARHPRKLLRQQKRFGLIYSQGQKISALECSGVQVCLLIDFLKIKDLSKEEFLARFIDPARIGHVIVGYDFHFGQGRSGHVDDIRTYCRRHSIRFSRVPAVRYEHEAISSNRIRALVEEGNFDSARACLGRPYTVVGKVVHGAAVGRTIGIPTANVKVETDIMPPNGVYRVKIRRLGQDSRRGVLGKHARRARVHKGLAYKGRRPAFARKGDRENIIEVFIFDFNEDIYGAYLDIEFLAFMRKPKVVRSRDGLKRLIEKDIDALKK
jgi:riboflavin kinase/FMN adenylyltransferase